MKPDFPLDWKPEKIGEKFVFTSKPSGLRLKDKDLVAFIPMELVPTHSLLASDFNLKKPSDIASGTYFEEGDLLVPKITPCFENGKQGIASGIPGGFGVASTEIIPIKAIPEQSNVEFLAYYLLDSEVRSALADKMEGTTGRQRLAKNVLQEWIMPFPPLPEQRAIASVLAKVQARIETQRRIVATLKELKAATMAKLFREGTRGERLKQTEIGEIPESWDVVKLSDLADDFSGGTPSMRCPEYWGGSIPWCSPKDMKKPRLSDTIDHVTDLGAKSGTRLVPSGSVFIVVRGMILVKDIPICLTTVPMTFNQDMKAFIPKDEMGGEFLLYVMRAFKEQLQLHISNAGHGTRRMGGLAIREMFVALPSKEERSQIVSLLATLDFKTDVAEQRCRVLVDLFSSLLHLLMSGSVRVTAQMIEEARHVS